MIKLVGILVIAAGFAFRFNTLLVVMVAGIATGLAAGMSFDEVMAAFGRAFVENRFVTLPVVLMVPVIGLLERHGLQERAAALIRRARRATSGRILFLYHAGRAATSTVGLNIGGHASMVRPLIAPMAEAAAPRPEAAVTGKAVGSTSSPASAKLTSGESHAIRAHAAAAENLGNFFADDVFVAVGPVLLIKGVFDSAHLAVPTWQIGLWGAPTAVCALLVGAWRYRRLDRRLAGGRIPA